jgi:hypothetical protein
MTSRDETRYKFELFVLGGQVSFSKIERANMRFQPTASLAALASRRPKRVPLGGLLTANCNYAKRFI